MLELQQTTTSRVIISGPTKPLAFFVAGDGRIASVDAPQNTEANEMSTLGMVDLQVNGFGGIDFNKDDLTAEELDHALTAMLATGVARCLPTIITAHTECLRARLRALDSAICNSRLGPVMIDGIHIEGPFLSAKDGYAGCHPKDAMRLPSIENFDYLTEGLRTPIAMMTLAPEHDGSTQFIRELVSRGTTVSLGHTRATRDQILQAIEAGATMSTHLGNGIAHMLEKNNNPLFAQLGEDRLIAGLIADGVHVPPYMLQSWIRAKQVSRVALVTDATAAAATRPGTYTLGDVTIERGTDGIVREPGSPYLAGSGVTLDQCVRNIMNWHGYDLATTFCMARNTPLSVLGKSAIPSVGDIAECVFWQQHDAQWHVTGARIGNWQVHINS